MGDNAGNSMAIQADGQILVAGNAHTPDSSGTGLWRFNPEGTADVTFGQGGWVPETITSGARTVSWYGVTIQPDGRIVCFGTLYMKTNPYVPYPVVARFWQ